MLPVSPLHTIYVEESGNPNGFPVFYLHGGPASGLGEEYRQFFDPKFFRIISFEQRGCGRSTPLGELQENTTWDLVEDIQRIRTALGIQNQKYLLFGGSWGSLLAIAAAETHPQDVAGLIVRGISLGRLTDIAWCTTPGQGVYAMYPEANQYWDEMMRQYPPSPEDVAAGRDPGLGVFDRVFNDPTISETERLKAVKLWRLANTYASGDELAEIENEKPLEAYRENLHTARIVCRYYYQNAFMNPSDQLIQNAERLKAIPHIFIVNGRDDIITPARRAFDFHRALQQAGVTQAQLKIVEDAGHSAWNPHTAQALLDSLQRFQHSQQTP
jgi:proline iminopeptidase